MEKVIEKRAKVSIVIPVYNVGTYLAGCLESIINQTMKDIEIICVDDASKDNSLQILKTYAEKDNRIKILAHTRNLGTSSARKHGVEIATGKYIMFLDSDDEYTLDACETAFNAIEENQTDIVKFGIEVINNTDEKIARFYQTKRIEPMYGRSILHLWFEGRIETSWNCCSKIYDATLCRKAYAEVEDSYFLIAEDLYYFFVHGYYAKSYSEIEDVLYKYRKGVGGYSGLNSGCDLNALKRILNEKDVYDAIDRFIRHKADKNDFQPMVKKIYEHLLNENIAIWSNKLRESDKEKGFEMLVRTWLTDNVFATMKLLDAWRKKYGKIDERLQKNLTARIDVKNFGEDSNSILVTEISDMSAKIQAPAWFKNEKGQGSVIQSTKESLTLGIKCIGDGELKIVLRGMDCKDKNNKRFPVWIDFTRLSVNDKDIFTNSHVVCHDRPFIYNVNVTDGDNIRLNIEWKALDATSDCSYIADNLDAIRQRDKVIVEKENLIKMRGVTIAKLNQLQQKLEELQRDLQKNKKQTEDMSRELNNVKTGWSFRLGRIITFIPRKIGGWL